MTKIPTPETTKAAGETRRLSRKIPKTRLYLQLQRAAEPQPVPLIAARKWPRGEPERSVRARASAIKIHECVHDGRQFTDRETSVKHILNTALLLHKV